MIYLSTAYFPNIYFFSKFLLSENIVIEAFEHYQRRTYRNRCEILSANGKINLQVPINKRNTNAIKDVLVDYGTNWQKQHFKTLESAYQSSPFFEYIIDDFMFVFEKKEKYVFDLNLKIIETILNFLHLENNISFTKEYKESYEKDFRNRIHPRNPIIDNDFKNITYYQTFNNKFPFVSNLSILDLLFNEGNNAQIILKESILDK